MNEKEQNTNKNFKEGYVPEKRGYKPDTAERKPAEQDNTPVNPPKEE